MKERSDKIRSTNNLLINKKGQFFLIAALVIIAIIIGLASVQIASKTSKENVVIFNLANEIDLEGKAVVDHGIFMDLTDEQLKCKLVGKRVVLVGCNDDGILSYYIQAYPDKEIVVVYGNPSGYNVVKEEEVDLGKIAICPPTGCTGIPQIITQITSTSGSCPILNEPCTIQLVGKDDLPISEAEINEQGQTFYAVIVGTTEEGEVYTADTSSLSKPTE